MTGATQQYRPRTTRSLTIVTATRDSSSALSPVVPIDRLRMARDSYHDPVLATEIVEMFAGLPAGVVVDATVGGGGHAVALFGPHHNFEFSASIETQRPAPSRASACVSLAIGRGWWPQPLLNSERWCVRTRTSSVRATWSAC